MAKRKERKEEEKLPKNAGDNNKMVDEHEETAKEQTASPETSSETQQTKESSEKTLIEELKKQLEEKEKELKEVKNKYLMALAEIENMRKKMIRDKQSFYRSGIKDMALSILQILDDVERAVEQIESANDINAIKEGILLIQRKFKQILEAREIKPIESKGQPFNPDLHEALMRIETDKDEDHMKVIDELQKGYMIGDEVLRHSRVVVAVKKDDANKEKGSNNTPNNKDDSEEKTKDNN